MNLISWNVNGFRAVLKKGFEKFFVNINADIFCIQETKMQAGEADFNPDGYYHYFNSAIKKGYSGTAVFTKEKPVSVTYGINGLYNDEGRILTLEYDTFYLVNCYSPNSQRELLRLAYRMDFENRLREYLSLLNREKPVILCGDLNVAHHEIDLKNPKANIGNAGFSYEERDKLSELLNSGFTDSYRYLYPDKRDAYTWWSYMFKSREKNIGWRIDYFILSNDITNKIEDALIYPGITGSDHCPVGLEINVSFY